MVSLERDTKWWLVGFFPPEVPDSPSTNIQGGDAAFSESAEEGKKPFAPGCRT